MTAPDRRDPLRGAASSCGIRTGWTYLDREDDFAYRLRYLAAVLEKLEENETGTIRWDAEGSARFIRIKGIFGEIPAGTLDFTGKP